LQLLITKQGVPFLHSDVSICDNHGKLRCIERDVLQQCFSTFSKTVRTLLFH